ncbi:MULTISPECIES: hypothetical protein [Bacillus subtilis group]|uniref:hypothetical protein n=1 Tax=Bacillus subtilis group TaxID=653685 RepID=UPI0011A3EF5F|nr:MULTISPECIES: hypothetical protein [Bacillus subtilis group]MCJ8222332.1 hypothetical protein [Bacillus paralicheniformis]MEC0720705.1 hypothetical protein [Bacillus haynesii]TWN69623.1 hypothetical protein CHCC10893_3469 [Bacillus licheniformis]
MKEAFINYLPELIGAIIIAVLSYLLTRRNEKARAKDQLEAQKIKFENEKEKIKIEYDAKLKEQELRLNHEKDLLEKQYQQEIEKYNMQTEDQQLNSIFKGDYDVDKMIQQMEGFGELLEKAEKLDKKVKSGTFKNFNHPANKK